MARHLRGCRPERQLSHVLAQICVDIRSYSQYSLIYEYHFCSRVGHQADDWLILHLDLAVRHHKKLVCQVNKSLDARSRAFSGYRSNSRFIYKTRNALKPASNQPAYTPASLRA